MEAARCSEALQSYRNTYMPSQPISSHLESSLHWKYQIALKVAYFLMYLKAMSQVQKYRSGGEIILI